MPGREALPRFGYDMCQMLEDMEIVHFLFGLTSEQESTRRDNMKGRHWVAVIIGCVMMGMLYIVFPFFSAAAGRMDLAVSVMIWVAYALCVVMAGLFEYKILKTKEIDSG